ncbi:hypothetical protein [Flavihumibacter fluvii]|uniref:hypothetical protein n=1 Tax=Flavihumibacter fluvii TaxID=2838157 RepID=UPI001BDF08FF|nr:hypothetical protein [Flavihumibacter fluvii]ULQ53533.1 hypothetical protein KJS93_04265 [Flavihumibacter fluvii]
MLHCFLYVDPGSGSYLIQMIIAAVLGALFYFKNIWWRIRTFFGRKRGDAPTKSNELND